MAVFFHLPDGLTIYFAPLIKPSQDFEYNEKGLKIN